MSFLSSLWNRKRDESPDSSHESPEYQTDTNRVEIIFESDEEDKGEEDKEEEALGTERYRYGNKSINTVDARMFIKYTRNWSFNRSIDEEHVAALKRELLKSENPDLMGTFKVLVQERKSHSEGLCARIIDGQHRYSALQQIIDDDTKFNIPVVLEVYRVNDIDGPDAWSLFYKANNVLNVQEKDKSASSASCVVTLLSREFPTAVYDPKGNKNRVNFPNVDRRALFERLKKSDIFTKFTGEEVYMLVLKKNLELSRKKMTDFTNLTTNKTKRDRIEIGYKKCYKTGCYLGLHPESHNFHWFREIEIDSLSL